MKTLALFLALTACVSAQPFNTFGYYKAPNLVTVYPLRTSLVAAWQFESTGTDTTANAFNLTANNSPTYNAGIVGNAAYLATASKQYFSRVDGDSLDLVATDFTVTTWVYQNSFPAFTGLVTKSSSLYAANDRQWAIGVDGASRKVNFFIDSSTSKTTNCISSKATTLGSWYFIACGYSSARRMYWCMVNDSTKDSLNSANRVQNYSFPLVIGGSAAIVDATAYLDGRIDQVMIWRRELTPAELTFLYNSRNGRSYADVIGYTP